MRNLLLPVAMLAFASATPAYAQQLGQSPCDDAGSMVDISNCYQSEIERADAELNETYKQITGVLYDNEKKSLRAAQLAWIAFRDAGCEAEATLYNGGSGKGIVRQACLEALTRERVLSLRRGFWWRVEKFGDGY